MKHALSLSLFALVGLAIADVPKEWSARYAGITKTIRAKNIDSFQRNFAPDFVSVDPKGKVTPRGEFLRNVTGSFKGVDRVETNLKLHQVHKSGDMVHVDFDLHIKLHQKGGVARVHEAGTDTWRRTGGQWKMVKTVDRLFTIK